MESSSSYNQTEFDPQGFSVYSFLSSFMICIVSGPTSSIYISYIIITVSLHLPLSLFILYKILQRLNKRSSSSAAALSHFDCFTCHLASMELIGVIGVVLMFCGIYNKEVGNLLEVGILMLTFTWFGELFFHLLTCLERYLAVVHPIFYLNLRARSWIRIRNMITSCVWLLSLLLVSLVTAKLFYFVNFSSLMLSVAVVSFCNFSVLKVLVRPRLGEQAERADQSKKRAFYTIMAILAALLLRLAFGLCWVIMFTLGQNDCVTMTIDCWFDLPCSLVLQTLFLHRTGSLMCKRKI